MISQIRQLLNKDRLDPHLIAMHRMYDTRIEVIAHMLEVANTSASRNYGRNENAIINLQMMYKGLLQRNRLAEYVYLLLENELLAYRESDRRYKITEKGLRFLHLYRDLRQMISGVGVEIIQEYDTSDGLLRPPHVTTTLTAGK
jgi:predicted transcriptional regulator